MWDVRLDDGSDGAYTRLGHDVGGRLSMWIAAGLRGMGEFW